MPLLKHSVIRPPCDECRRPFNSAFGGVCPQCRRLLCPDHLYGSIWQRVKGTIGLTVSCARCRSVT